MKTDLSNIHPTIAGALSGFVNPKSQPERLYLCHSDAECIIVAKTGQSALILLPDDLKKINELAEQIGWACD